MHVPRDVLGVTGFAMKNLAANPLDCTEGGAFNRHREEFSAILDMTDPISGRFRSAGQDDCHHRHQ